MGATSGWPMAVVALLVLAGCGGGGGDDPREGDPKYTIGGTVSGLEGSGLVLRVNGSDDLAIGGNGPFTFATPLYEGTPYAVTVQAQPAHPAQYCSVGGGSAPLVANVTNVVVNCSSMQALYPAHGGRWNDWVMNDGATMLAASDTACTIEAGRGYWNNCLHAGELRRWDSQRVVACTGLVVRDALDAFDWVCSQGPAGNALFTSVGLKPERRLSDLIDFTALAWRDNRVLVSGAQTFESPAGRWWSNPVVVNNTGATTVAGAINLVTADTQANYKAADALVIQPGRVLRAPAGGIAVEGRNVGIAFWLEGEIDARGGTNGVLLQGYAASVLRGVRVSGAVEVGISLSQADGFSSSSGLHVHDVRADHNGGVGVQALGGHRLNKVRAHDNGGTGVRGEGRFTDIVSSHNGGFGLEMTGTNDVAINVTATDNASNGIWLGSRNQGRGTLAAGLLAVNNGFVGIEVSASSAGNTLADLAAAGNAFEGLRILSSGHRLTGIVKVAALGDCRFTVAGCVNIAPSDALFAIGGGIPGAFVAKVTGDDAANASDGNGSAAFGAITDWTRFDHDLRGWGPDGGTFPAADQRGPCPNAATCRIWDWSLRAADTVLRDVLALPGGDDVIVHTWFAPTSADCAVIRGAVWDAGASACRSTLLRRAIEMNSASVANGLCEAGESCLHAPNFGAYQGHGALVSAGAPTGGLVSGVRLQRYTTNGR